MELKEFVEMELENISKEDAALLGDMEYMLGRCGITNGSGSCGGSDQEN